MNRSLLNAVLRQVGGLAAPAAEPDAALLGRFAAGRDEAAFAELVRRHGPMVWAVCRHLLSDHADAEDAFQATFLALVRSAGRVRKPHALGGWLHGVAVKAATKLKRAAVRRKQREQRAAAREGDRPVPEGTWDALMAAVHEEVRRLPEGLRAAFVLCDLQGVGQPDAAARLGWKPGTLTGRLCKARQTLVARLTGRGLAPALAGGGAGLGVATAGGAVPTALCDKVTSLIKADGAVPAALLQLVREVTPMVLTRTKLLAAAVLVAGGLVTAGVGTGLIPVAGAQQPPGGGGSGDGAGLGLPTPTPADAPPADLTAEDAGLAGAGGAADDEPPPPKRPRTAPPAAQPGPRGGGGPPMAGGGPGMPPGGMGMPGMGGGSAAAHAGWEYKFEAPNSWDRRSFERLVTRNGNDGWEYAGSEQFDDVRLVVFKRRNGGAVAGGMMGPMGQFQGGFGGGFPGGGLGAPMPGFGGGSGGGVGGPPAGGGEGGRGFGGFPGGGGGGFGGGRGGGGGSGIGPAPGAGGGRPAPEPKKGGGTQPPAAGGRVIAGGGGDTGGPGAAGGGGAGSLDGPSDTVTVRLKTADATLVAQTLRQVYGNTARLSVVVDDRTNSLVLTASPTDVAVVRRLVEKLDADAAPSVGGSAGAGGTGALVGGSVGPGGGMALMGGGAGGPPPMAMMGGGAGGPPPKPAANRPVVVRLKHASAPDVSQTLGQVFNGVKITPDNRTNSLIIRADADTLREVRALVEELDTPADNDDPGLLPPQPIPGGIGAPGGAGLPPGPIGVPAGGLPPPSPAPAGPETLPPGGGGPPPPAGIPGGPVPDPLPDPAIPPARG